MSLGSLNMQAYLRAAMIAALYVVLTCALAPFSYGPLQFRLSEALTVLPILYPEAIWGLFVGAAIANIFGGLGVWDIFGGSLATLLAAWLTWRWRASIAAYLAPVAVNAVVVSAYLSLLYAVPYWLTVVSIGASEALAVFVLGYPLIRLLRRRMKQ